MKFKATAKGLQSWSDKRVGHFKSQIEVAKEIIHQLDIAQDSRQLSPLETWLRNNLKKHSLALSSLMRTIARIRSRITWLRDGDANTSLFHLHARHRKKKNFIAKLKEGDRVVTTHEDKAEVLLNFFSNLIGTREERQHTLDLEALSIQRHELEALDAPISEDEVWNFIKQLPSDKAPGPDGFTGRFYKICWGIIKGDIMAAVSAVWRRFQEFQIPQHSLHHLVAEKRGCYGS